VTLDAAELAVLIGRLEGIADEMGAVLRRAAFSPNIKERADCSAALFTADGEQLVQAEHIPVHLGAMPASVRAVLVAFPRAEGLNAGDQVVVNDPFAGGTHLNDVTFVAPVFLGAVLVGWAANRAHHADLGGGAPGSMPADATEIYQEGLRIPPVVYSQAVRDVILANSRTPEERGGDLDAQVGANVLGASRLAELVATGEPLDEVLAYGERRMRAALTAMRDGTWTFEDVIDSTGEAADQQRAARIVVAVTVSGDRITFDFTGTDPQRAGNVNAVEAVTVSSVAFALRVATDPTIPANGGALRPVEVIAPAGTIVAARPPAAVGAGNVEVSQRVADVCLGALSLATPGTLGAASQGTMNNLIVGGHGWVYYETLAGGQGARPGRDGMSGVHTGMTNTRNTPIEALEQSYPMRVVRCRLRTGSGGDGAARGGDGIERDLEVLEDATVSLITERRVSRPWGVDGGESGAPGENWLLPGGDESRATKLADKCTVRVRAGDVIRVLTPGGGGFGDRAHH
jgi:N-methylhydantoinase B/oxoprolinase/acetone carboxylase alpha subunit